MISVPQSLNDIFFENRSSGKVIKGIYAQTIMVSNFDGYPGLAEIDSLKWIYADRQNTWVIIHREHKFNLWNSINLLHSAARELAWLSFIDPECALIRISFVNHIFNAVQESTCRHDFVQDFLTTLHASKAPSFNLSATQKIQLSRLKKANFQEYTKLLIEKCRAGSLEHTAIAYEAFGRLCPLYHIDPFPFHLGSIDKIPLPVLALCMKMKRFAHFLTDNTDKFSYVPEKKAKEGCVIN